MNGSETPLGGLRHWKTAAAEHQHRGGQQQNTQGEQQLWEPAGGGCFELSVNGELVYSKLETGAFPDEDQMVSEVGRRL